MQQGDPLASGTLAFAFALHHIVERINIDRSNTVCFVLYSSPCRIRAYSHNALRVLQENDFQIIKDWYELLAMLNVPIDIRRGLLQHEKDQQHYLALEECLDHFIRNHPNASWKTFVDAVEKLDHKVAKSLRVRFMQKKGTCSKKYQLISLY